MDEVENKDSDAIPIANGCEGTEIQQPTSQEHREAWSSRVAFWLGAIGSAVGLGNLWRFPYQCAAWGGGAFIFAYLICLFTIGMPLLTQELSLGQKHRSGDIEAFGRMNWRLRGIGLASVIGSFTIVTYYMMLIGVSTVFFFESFFVPLPYDDPDYYKHKILLQPDSIEDSLGIMSGKLFLATCLCWIVTFICVHRGVKTASTAVKITMPLPFLLLLILLIKGLTLEGASDGIKKYFDFSDWTELESVGIWNAAIGQCFFSLGVCMGVMTAYGSYNPIDQDIATDEKVISFADLAASLMSGFVVYSVLGYLVATTGDTDWYDAKSLGLVFAAYPVAISTFEGANFFGVIFYLCLVLLGIDSAFSLIEAISTVIYDSDLNKRLQLTRPKITATMCGLGFLGSCLFCFDTGIYWLDIVDRYVNNYGMVFLGMCETGACGWFYGYHSRIHEKVGELAANIYRTAFLVSIVITATLSIGLESVFEADRWYYGWIIGFSIGGVIWFSSIWIAFCYRNDYARRNLSFSSTMWYLIGWDNVDILRDFINVNGVGSTWNDKKHTCSGESMAVYHHGTIGIYFGFYVKYFIPFVLLMNLIGTMKMDTLNPYSGFEWKYLAVGIVIFSLMVIVVFVVAVFPQLMTQSGDKDNRMNVEKAETRKVDNGATFSPLQQTAEDEHETSIEIGVIEQ
eukprot:242294_1